MTEERIHLKILIVMAAIIVNGLILYAIPHLARNGGVHRERTDYDGIFISKYEPLKEQTAPERKLRRQPEEVKPKTVSRTIPKRKAMKVNRPKLALKMPEIQLEINPRLVTGLDIPAPPEEKHIPVKVSGPPSTKPAQAVETASVKTEFDSSEVDRAPVVIQKMEPAYPRRAKRRNITGQVTVKFLVTQNGDVSKLSILDAEPKGVFENSVMNALPHWRFEPGYYKGKPVRTWVVIPILFNLKG
jgi:protein TonB